MAQFYNGFKWRGNSAYNPFASEELKKERMDMCRACDQFKPSTQQCNKCGCFMQLKTKMKDAHCPIDKW
tara:strand:+ start:110 stop:316 length:207 start_codon:yes stop_codon:yes gene_type:complete